MTTQSEVNTRIYGKEGDTTFPLNPQTTAAQVTINDASGSASTVSAEIVTLRQAIEAATAEGIKFKGVLDATHSLPTVSYKAGWQYCVKLAGTYAGKTCEVGDMVLCIKDYASGSASDSDWTVIQANIVGAVEGPASAVSNQIAVFDGTSGKIIKDSGFTIATSVPANAVFTDTTYNPATESADGLMSSSDKVKLNGIEAGADVTDTANVTAAGAFMISSNTADNITDGTTKVGMLATERTKLSGIDSGAEVNQNAYQSMKVGDSTMSATNKTDTFEIAAGDGITLTAGTKKVTVAETYVDTCIVSSLSNVPANLRNGGLIILKQS